MALLSITVFPNLSEADQSPHDKESILIHTYNEDITGDGQKDKINLKGVRFSNGSHYFHNVWADIITPQNKKWKITYKGGYNPKLSFKDLNHDGITDLLFQSKRQDTEHNYQYQLNTIKNDALRTLKIPKSFKITGEFRKGFQATLLLDPSKPPITINLKQHANNYINKGLYNKDGTLLMQQHLDVNQITQLKPVFISKEKGFGLQSQQNVNGTNQHDRLGEIDALWYFEQGRWIKLKQTWNRGQQHNQT